MKIYSLYVSFYLFFKNVISFHVMSKLCELLAFLYHKPLKHQHRRGNNNSWQVLYIAFNPYMCIILPATRRDYDAACTDVISDRTSPDTSGTPRSSRMALKGTTTSSDIGSTITTRFRVTAASSRRAPLAFARPCTLVRG